MPVNTEDDTLIAQASAYAAEIYREITDENGTPTVGVENQAVDFILGDPELREAVARWGAQQPHFGEASTRPPRRVPEDALYRRVRDFIAGRLTPGRDDAPPRPPLA